MRHDEPGFQQQIVPGPLPSSGGGDQNTKRALRSPLRNSTGRRYSIVHPLWMSFFSREFYQDVGRNWRGLSFVYLMFLLFLCWIPTMTAFQRKLSEFMRTSAREFIVQVPRINIFHGEVWIDAEQPYFIKNPENGSVFAIIDTTGQHTSLDGVTANILITKRKAILRKNKRETRVFDLSDIENFTLDQHLINRWMGFLEKWFVVIIFPLLLLSSFFYRTIQVLIYAAVGTLFAKAKKAHLSFQGLMSIVIMSITPVLIIDTLLGLGEIKIPFWRLWCVVMAMAYLFFGVKVNAEEELPREPNKLGHGF